MFNNSGMVIAALIASLAFAGLAVATILALLQLRRTAQAAQQTLSAVEREVRPLAVDLLALLQQHRDLAQRANQNLREVERMAVMVQEVLARIARLTSFLGSMGTVGKVLGVAQGLQKGAAVFLGRLRRRPR